MTFYDPIDRCNISSTCAMLDHKMEEREGEFHQDKENGYLDDKRRWKRRYYIGKLIFCSRIGCYKEEFDGVQTKTNIVIGDVEYTEEEYHELLDRRYEARVDEAKRRRGDTGNRKEEG